ncbi:MAG: hypothetical protein ACRD8K_02730, partial [Nitrososphaeraceae archaeon]
LFLSYSVIILKLNLILNQLFQQEIVNCIKNNEYFLYQEEDTFLISTTLFNIIRSKHRDSITSLFLPVLERFNLSSHVA